MKSSEKLFSSRSLSTSAYVNFCTFKNLTSPATTEALQHCFRHSESTTTSGLRHPGWPLREQTVPMLYLHCLYAISTWACMETVSLWPLRCFAPLCCYDVLSGTTFCGCCCCFLQQGFFSLLVGDPARSSIALIPCENFLILLM